MDEGCSKAVREVFVNLYEQGSYLSAATASSTGARTARPPFRMPRSSTKSRQATSGTSATRWRTAAAIWSICDHPSGDAAGRYRRGGQSRTTSATSDLIGKTVHPADRGPRDPDRRRRIRRHGVRHRRASRLRRAHDPNDFEVGQRHNLPSIHVMNDDAHHQRKRRQVSRAWIAMSAARRL